MRTRALLLVLLLAGLLPACGEQTVATAEDPQDRPEGAYATHVLAYGGCLADIDQDILEAFDCVILEAQGFSLLEPRFREKAVLYFNMWGKSCYRDTLPYWTEWQPAPGELGEPDVIMNVSVHCYRFDDAHVARFLSWIETFLAEHGSEVGGVFLDDFGYTRIWWGGSDEARDLVWGPWDGRPGWREEPYTWNTSRVETIEIGARSLLDQYAGEQSLLICNGTARRLERSRRFAEKVGSPSESWESLIIAGVDSTRYARPGDFLQVNGVGASGLWGDWLDSSAGNGYENLVQAAALARERGLSVGLSYGVKPASGGSIYSLFFDPGNPFQPWPYYLSED